MTPAKFKELWSPVIINQWLEFDIKEIEKAPVNDLTKAFLKVGFPSFAAPFLDFGWISYGNKFTNISQYWVLGSDNNGNPICFDVENNDRVILLDHEQGIELIALMNKDIVELAQCLLLYKNFISRIQSENGEDAFLDLNISDDQLNDLMVDFKELNFNIFRESDFWRSEINALKNKRKS